MDDSRYPYLAVVGHQVVLYVEIYSSQPNQHLNGLQSLAMDSNCERMSFPGKLFLVSATNFENETATLRSSTEDCALSSELR